jgi:uncharacterized membrane protein
MADGEDRNPNPAPAPPPDPAAHVAALEARVQRLEEQNERLEQRIHALDDLLAQRTARPAPPVAPPPRPTAASPAAAPPPRTYPVPPLLPEPAAQHSLEARVGAQFFNRIGIVAVLLGATLFLKLAMDNHWLGPLGRILIGLVAGAALVLWSERFRRQNFAAFSYSLKAVGSGVLYLSLWAGFQLYHLLPAPAAFALMLAVTLWNAFMAWSQSSELLAVYALGGAFATPLLLSTGGSHQVFLFSYLLAIDVATVGLVRVQQRRPQPWPRLLLLALPATAAYFMAWFVGFYSAGQMVSTSAFLALFFLTFLTAPLEPFSAPFPAATGEREGFQPTAEKQDSDLAPPTTFAIIPDLLLPLANAGFGSLALYSVLEDAGHHAALPWFSLLFAGLYLGVVRLPQRPAARAIHLSLAVVFLTIAIPLKASGAAIPLAWLAEAVGLLWAANRFESRASSRETDSQADPLPRTLRLLAVAALILGFLGILLHPLWIYPGPITAFFNRRFASALAGILAFAASAVIALAAIRREAGYAAARSGGDRAPGWLEIAVGSIVALNLVALEAGVLEIQTFWYRTLGHSDAQLETALSISAFLALYGAALLAAGFLRRNAFLRWQALALLLVAIAKTFLYDVRSLSEGYRVVSFLGLGALLMAISFAYQKDWLNLRAEPTRTSAPGND